MHPPKPAPVSRAPYAPCSSASSTKRSSSGVDTAKSSRSDAWLSHHQPPARTDVAGAQGVDERSDPCVLGDDVARDRIVGHLRRRRRRATSEHRVDGRPLRTRRAGRRTRSQRGGAARPLWTTMMATEAGSGTGVDRRACGSRAAARDPGAPEHRRHLIHHAARHAAREVLGLLRGRARSSRRSSAKSATWRSRERERDLERRARRQSRPDRHRRRDLRVEADAFGAPRRRASDSTTACGPRRVTDGGAAEVEPSVERRPDRRRGRGTRRGRRGRSRSAGTVRPGSRCGRRSG